MLVGEIMTSPAVTVRKDASPQVAVKLLAQRRLTMLPVLDTRRRLVGVLSEADLVIGVQAIGVQEGHRHGAGSDGTSGSAPAESSADTWVCPPPSGTGVDQL
jgi:Mg/Co/Ni transporter MgtE